MPVWAIFFLLRLVKALQRSEQDLNKRSCQVVFFLFSCTIFPAPCKHTPCCAHNPESVCVYVFTGTTHERDCVCHYEILKVGVFALSDRPATANGAVRVCMCMCVCVWVMRWGTLWQELILNFSTEGKHRALSISERAAYPLNYLCLASARRLSRLLSHPSFCSGLFLP